MKQFLVFALILIGSLQGVKSQVFQEDYKNREDSTLADGLLFLDLPLSTWFYNNEYFNPFYKGYTLIGADVLPRLVYQSNPVLKLSAGAYIHRCYGDTKKTIVSPLFSIEYKPGKQFSILMGTFNGGENHGLPEALFSFENHLTDIVENGILIRYRNSRIQSETWLNWESFIEPGDTFREQFSFGCANKILLLESSSWKLTLPVNVLAHHAGGQINDNNEHVESLFNISEGLRLNRYFTSNLENSVFAEVNLFHSLGDFHPSPGQAVSVKAGVQLKQFELNGEYFRGKDFISFTGNPLFRSWEASGDPATPYIYGGVHEMLNFKAGFRQKIGPASFLFFRFEGYYFTATSKLDYSYSLHFQVNDFLKIASLKRR